MSNSIPRVQILVEGGFVIDVSPDTWRVLQMERSTVPFLEFEDLYGSPCGIKTGAIMAWREWTAESGARYREIHGGEEGWNG